MDTKEKYLYLLEDVRDKIILLQRAVDNIEATKKSLKTTAVEVKSQIRDSISRHLEALRNRETWLLGQVEVIQHIKEESLRRQQAQLNQTLGALQSTLAMLEHDDGINSIEMLEEQVLERLESSEQFNLVPEESDYLAFSATNFGLLEMIHNFGDVDSGSSVLEKQICESFQELHVARSGADVIGCLGKKRSFHSPSGPNQDWILKKGICKPTTQVKFQHPNDALEPKDWLAPSQISQLAPSTRCVSLIPQMSLSIDQWLSDCQRNKESMGETDQEPTDEGKAAAMGGGNACMLSLAKWLLRSEERQNQSPGDLFSYYQTVQQSDMSQWLVARDGSAPYELSTNLIGETYARIATSSPEQWLARGAFTAAVPEQLRTTLIGDTYARIAASSAEEWLASKSPLKTEGRASVGNNTREACLECTSCLDGMCQSRSIPSQEKSFDFSETSSDLSEWLAVKKEDMEESSAPGSDADFTMESVDVEDVPNWLLKSWSRGKEKESQEDNAGANKYSKDLSNSAMEAWLCPPSKLPKFDVVSVDDTGMKKYAEKLSSDSDQLWLCQPQSDSKLEDPSEKITSGAKAYLEALSGDYNQWLTHQPNNASICKWLARSSTSRCKNCPKMCSKGLFTVFDEVANHTNETWLLPTAETV